MCMELSLLSFNTTLYKKMHNNIKIRDRMDFFSHLRASKVQALKIENILIMHFCVFFSLYHMASSDEGIILASHFNSLLDVAKYH